MSPRTMDRVLHDRRQALQRRLYGRTKPGALLKHQIPLKIDRWDTTVPGFTEIDLVTHSGLMGEGDCLHSVNLTDIHTTRVETRAVLDKTQRAGCARRSTRCAARCDGRWPSSWAQRCSSRR